MLAPGTARRRALDDALAEMEAGLDTPSSRLEDPLRADARPRAGSERAPAAADVRDGAPPSPDRRARGNAHRADRGEPEGGERERERSTPSSRKSRSSRTKRTTSRSTARPSFRRRAGGGRRSCAPVSLPPPDGFREDDRSRRIRRGGAHRRRLDPHPPAPARLPVQPRAHGRGVRRAAQAGGRQAREEAAATGLITVQTYAWFARHVNDLEKSAYQLVICDEAHTALGEKTSAAIRSYIEPVYIGMTATEQLIAKQVSDVFPASVDDLPLQDAARRGLIAPLRCLRVPPAAAINSVPIVGGDFEERALAEVLDHQALNQAAASLYRDRFDSTPGIVYAAGVDHAYNLAREFRAAGLKAEAVSGRTPPVKLAEILAAYERGEIDILINAMLLAEGWNSPRATVCMHLAPTAQPPGLPAAHRPDHADASTEGGRRRRRLHAEGSDAQRARRLAPQPPRRRLLPRGRARDARASPAAAATRSPQALAGAVARPCDAGRQAPTQRDRARVAAGRPALSRRGRAALLGPDRRPPGPVRGACRLREEADRREREPRCLEQFLSPARPRTPTAAFG